jgi:hypothetical protein
MKCLKTHKQRFNTAITVIILLIIVIAIALFNSPKFVEDYGYVEGKVLEDGSIEYDLAGQADLVGMATGKKEKTDMKVDKGYAVGKFGKVYLRQDNQGRYFYELRDSNDQVVSKTTPETYEIMNEKLTTSKAARDEIIATMLYAQKHQGISLSDIDEDECTNQGCFDDDYGGAGQQFSIGYSPDTKFKGIRMVIGGDITEYGVTFNSYSGTITWYDKDDEGVPVEEVIYSKGKVKSKKLFDESGENVKKEITYHKDGETVRQKIEYYVSTGNTGSDNTYDEKGNIIGQINYNSKTGLIENALVFTYDNDGGVTSTKTTYDPNSGELKEVKVGGVTLTKPTPSETAPNPEGYEYELDGSTLRIGTNGKILSVNGEKFDDDQDAHEKIEDALKKKVGDDYEKQFKKVLSVASSTEKQQKSKAAKYKNEQEAWKKAGINDQSDQAELKKKGISAAQAAAYNKAGANDIRDMLKLKEKKISPTTLQGYKDAKQDVDDAIELFEAGISSKEAKLYSDGKITTPSIMISMSTSGISGSTVAAYAKKGIDDATNILELHLLGIGPGDFKDKEELEELVKTKIAAKKKTYDDSDVEDDDQDTLASAGVSKGEYDKYMAANDGLSVDDIAKLKRNGVSADEYEELKKKNPNVDVNGIIKKHKEKQAKAQYETQTAALSADEDESKGTTKSGNYAIGENGDIIITDDDDSDRFDRELGSSGGDFFSFSHVSLFEGVEGGVYVDEKGEFCNPTKSNCRAVDCGDLAGCKEKDKGKKYCVTYKKKTGCAVDPKGMYEDTFKKCKNNWKSKGCEGVEKLASDRYDKLNEAFRSQLDEYFGKMFDKWFRSWTGMGFTEIEYAIYNGMCTLEYYDTGEDEDVEVSLTGFDDQAYKQPKFALNFGQNVDNILYVQVSGIKEQITTNIYRYAISLQTVGPMQLARVYLWNECRGENGKSYEISGNPAGWYQDIYMANPIGVIRKHISGDEMLFDCENTDLIRECRYSHVCLDVYEGIGETSSGTIKEGYPQCFKLGGDNIILDVETGDTDCS